MSAKVFSPSVAFCAAAYLLAGQGGAVLAATASTHEGVVRWRLAVWLVCALIFGAQIVAERVQRGSSAMLTAQRAGFAVALGAFAVAVVALGRAIASDTSNMQRSYLALIIFPVAAGLPAFLVALVGSKIVPQGQPKQ